jgi:hypothetical protein
MLILLVLLICALYRGCRQFNKDETSAVDINGRIERLLKDSTEKSKQLKENKLQNELLDGQIELANNKNELYLDSFRLLNDYISSLKKRYKPIVPSIDTNVTTVPNEYIENCSGCFVALDKAQQLGLRYKSDLDNKDRLNLSKINTLNSRIGILEKQNIQLKTDYVSLLDSTKALTPTLKRTLFATIGAMAINQSFPNAIGGGLLYEDKKRRIFGAKYYISKYGSIYQGEVSFPLSLKKR